MTNFIRAALLCVACSLVGCQSFYTIQVRSKTLRMWTMTLG